MRISTVTVVSLGGSVLFPDGIDAEVLRKWVALLKARASRRHRFVVVVGGGKLARDYQAAAMKARRVPAAERDWLGIAATGANAALVQTSLGSLADPEIVDVPEKGRRLRKPVTVASGWNPGSSTDYVAARLAARFGARVLVNAGKPAFVYDKDPAKYQSAKPFARLTWGEYGAVVPHAWKPGASAPIDPVAARFLARRGIQAVMLQGRDTANVARFLDGKPFRGTLIG